MSTYYVIIGMFGHRGLYRYVDKLTAYRVDGDKPWGGASRRSTRFRSRSDAAAIRRFNSAALAA